MHPQNHFYEDSFLASLTLVKVFLEKIVKYFDQKLIERIELHWRAVFSLNTKFF